MPSSLLGLEVGRRLQPNPGEHAYGVFLHGRKNAPALSAKSPRSFPTETDKVLAIVTSCSPFPGLQKKLEFCQIPMPSGPLGSEVGRRLQPYPGEHAYGVFLHGRKNATALSANSSFNSSTQGSKDLKF